MKYDKRPEVERIMALQEGQFLSFDDHTTEIQHVNMRRARLKGTEESVQNFCNSSTILKIFQNKRLKKMQSKTKLLYKCLYNSKGLPTRDK